MTVVELLLGTRFSHVDEAGLQDAIETLLLMGYPSTSVVREARIGAGERIDFLVDGTGIEVKVAGSVASVMRQLRRYANTRQVDELVLVTTKVAHRELHGVTLSGVPVSVVIPAWL